MKKKFTLTTLSLFTLLFFAGCSKRSYLEFDERYWLSQEKGDVVYSSPTCDYYIIDTYNGYAVIQSSNGFRPFEGTVLYGNFSSSGTRDFYDPDNGNLVTGNVREYWLSYADAQQALSFYCN